MSLRAHFNCRRPAWMLPHPQLRLATPRSSTLIPIPLSRHVGPSQWTPYNRLYSVALIMPPPPSSYRPRKKRKFVSAFSGSNSALILETESGKSSPAFPLVSFLWAARAGVSQWLVLPLILMTVGLFRWAVSLWGYSGADPVAPM